MEGSSGPGGGAAKILKPTLGTSVLKTFRVVTGVLYLASWLIALPGELILHRRVGKRHMNSVVFGLSLILLTGLGVLAVRGHQAWVTPSGIYPPGYVVPASPSSGSGIWFGFMFAGSLIAFACHYVANRRRFGQVDQGHSMDTGVPWLCYPSITPERKNPFDDSGAGNLTAESADPSLFDSEPKLADDPATLRTVAAYPMSVIRQLRGHLAEHTAKLKNGEVPYGAFAWLTLSTIEPCLLLVAGGLFVIKSGTFGFGIYLGLVGIAMATKAAILAAEFKEKVYDDNDGRLEIEAMRRWREGKPLSAVSAAFTVPIMKAVLPGKSAMAMTVGTPEGFESLVGNAAPSDENNFGRNADAASA